MADCVFEKRDKRWLSVQGVIFPLIYSPISLFVGENKMELYMEIKRNSYRYIEKTVSSNFIVHAEVAKID